MPNKLWQNFSYRRIYMYGITTNFNFDCVIPHIEYDNVIIYLNINLVMLNIDIIITIKDSMAHTEMHL